MLFKNIFYRFKFTAYKIKNCPHFKLEHNPLKLYFPLIFDSKAEFTKIISHSLFVSFSDCD